MESGPQICSVASCTKHCRPQVRVCCVRLQYFVGQVVKQHCGFGNFITRFRTPNKMQKAATPSFRNVQAFCSTCFRPLRPSHFSKRKMYNRGGGGPCQQVGARLGPESRVFRERILAEPGQFKIDGRAQCSSVSCYVAYENHVTSSWRKTVSPKPKEQLNMNNMNQCKNLKAKAFCPVSNWVLGAKSGLVLSCLRGVPWASGGRREGERERESEPAGM